MAVGPSTSAFPANNHKIHCRRPKKDNTLQMAETRPPTAKWTRNKRVAKSRRQQQDIEKKGPVAKPIVLLSTSTKNEIKKKQKIKKGEKAYLRLYITGEESPDKEDCGTRLSGTQVSGGEVSIRGSDIDAFVVMTVFNFLILSVLVLEKSTDDCASGFYQGERRVVRDQQFPYGPHDPCGNHVNRILAVRDLCMTSSFSIPAIFSAKS